MSVLTPRASAVVGGAATGQTNRASDGAGDVVVIPRSWMVAVGVRVDVIAPRTGTDRQNPSTRVAIFLRGTEANLKIGSYLLGSITYCNAAWSSHLSCKCGLVQRMGDTR